MSDAAFLPGAGEPGLVSIVIPTYNRAYIIAATIESALRQTYANVEVLVADDGSKDDTRAIVERFTDPRVRYFWQPNAGCPAARNLAIRNARGEFIALLDSDDRWMPWKLEAQVALLRAHPEVGMVWTDMTAVTDAGELVEERHLRTFYGAYAEVEIEQVLARQGTLGELMPGADPAIASAPVYTGDLFSHLLLGSLVHTPTVVMRRDRVRQTGGFDETLKPAGEDYDFHLRTALHGAVGFMDVPAMYYRVGNEDQITAGPLLLTLARADLKTLDKWLELGRGRITLPERVIRNRQAKSHHWIGYEAFQLGHFAEARANLARSLRLRPWQPYSAALLLGTLVPRGAVPAAKRAKRRFVSLHPIQRVGSLVAAAGLLLYGMLSLLDLLGPDVSILTP